MADFVLVHGGWHGGWCWQDVATRLIERGHRVLCPTLTGLGERMHLIEAVTGPDTHVTDVVNVIRFNELERVILVGHSYAGNIITGVATLLPERISSLVYLDAFVPTVGGQPTTSLSIASRNREILDSAVPGEPGIPASGFERWAESAETIAWLKTMVTPHPVACFGKGVSRITDPSTLDLSRTYIFCTKHQPSPFQQFHQRYEDDPGWRSLTMDCLHDAMVERPEELTQILLTAITD